MRVMNNYAKKILVVDDDPGILDALQLTLEDAGYEVTTTEKGDYAENLRDTNGDLPDVIILDVLLSGKDGRIICQKLKSQEDTRHVPIIMISAHPGAKQSVKAVGADDFLAKPFDIDVLLAKIAQYLWSIPAPEGQETHSKGVSVLPWSDISLKLPLSERRYNWHRFRRCLGR